MKKKENLKKISKGKNPLSKSSKKILSKKLIIKVKKKNSKKRASFSKKKLKIKEIKLKDKKKIKEVSQIKKLKIKEIKPEEKKRGFFSKFFGKREKSNGPNKKLTKNQETSFNLIKNKEEKVLEKLKNSKIHPEIAKNLKKIDELKKANEGNLVKIEKKNAPDLKNKLTKFSTEKFFKTHISGFDDLVHPGLPEGSAILIEGGPGSGKTLWCLNLLKEMCKEGKKVLYMSFEEPEERLRQHIDSFGLDSKVYEEKGLLYLKRFNALDIARSVEALLSDAKNELLIDVQPVLIPKDFDPDIVVIDSLSSISSAFSGESSRFRIYMEQLFRYLEGHNITSFLIREVSSPTHIGGTTNETGGEAVSFLSDGIIAIYNVIYDSGTRKRALEVLKMRGVKIDRKIVEYEIGGKGVIIRSKKVLKGKYKLT